MSCYCDQDLDFTDCCEPYLSGQELPPTPVALMRSRYSAFATMNVQYLIETWDERFRPANLQLEPKQQWLGLKIIHHQTQGDHGEVKFVARYKVNGKGYRLEEHSLFHRNDGRWYYLHEST